MFCVMLTITTSTVEHEAMQQKNLDGAAIIPGDLHREPASVGFVIHKIDDRDRDPICRPQDY